MSRRELRQNESSVTLFPFLAVLICTMGALIVLLVVLVQQARTLASSTTETTAAELELPPAPVPAAGLAATASPPSIAGSTDEPESSGLSADDLATLQQQAEDLAWQAEVLSESREATRRRLQEQRRELSKLEDQSEQLRQQLESLETQAQELLDAEAEKSLENEASAANLAQVQAEIRRARDELAKVQQAVKEKRRKFAVVPYHGRHETQRRPVYIECRGDQVKIQPEGVLLVPEDFQRPIGPGNPLAMALRAAREYLLRAGLTAATGEPYPLLLVRPEGAQAYAACRAALDGWDDEFGYELIDNQTELAFLPADEGLARAMEDAIARAREQREFELVGETAPTFRASRNGGGFVREGGRHRSGSTRGGTGSGPHGDDGRAGVGPVTAPAAKAAATDVQLGANNGPGPGAGRQPSAADGGKGSGISHELVRGSAFPTDHTTATSASQATESSRGQEEISSGPGGGAQVGAARENFWTGVPDSGIELSQGKSSSQSPGTDGRTAAGGAKNSPGQTPADGGSGGSSPSGGAAISMSLTPSASSQSLARTRGRNWALPNAADGAIGISRPINVVCEPGSLRINPELGVAAASQDISFSSSTEAAVQPFVSAIWQRIESWGIAGPGVYWKPMVQVAVQPGAEPRFAQLQVLLQGSGLELIRR